MKNMVRRGISPVIATLLLIVIAVVAAVLTYVWVTGYMGTLAPRETPTQLKERIKIDAVQVGDNIVTIYVSNIGEVQTQIVGAYVLTENYVAVCGNSSVSENISAGQSKSVTVNGCTLTSGTYIAKVSSKGGAEATYIFRKS